MYKKGDYVVYGASGTCKVEDVTRLKLPGCDGKRKYYVLRPVNSDKSTIYSPIDNDRVRIRDIVTEEEIRAVLEHTDEPDVLEIPNEKQREEIYKDILRNADFRRGAALAISLVQKRRERLMQGRKFTAVDERYLHEIVGLLSTEISVVLGIDRDSAMEMLNKGISQVGQ